MDFGAVTKLFANRVSCPIAVRSRLPASRRRRLETGGGSSLLKWPLLLGPASS